MFILQPFVTICFDQSLQNILPGSWRWVKKKMAHYTALCYMLHAAQDYNSKRFVTAGTCNLKKISLVKPGTQLIVCLWGQHAFCQTRN